MLILSAANDLGNPAIIAALIAATVSLLLGYLKPFSERRNSEVSTLHSESVWREQLFSLASCPSDEIDRTKIELFRTFLSATRGTKYTDQSNSYSDVPYDANFRTSRGPNLDDICMVHYRNLLLELNLPKKGVTKEAGATLRELCRLLLKSDWNTRINSSEFFTVNSEIICKAATTVELYILKTIEEVTDTELKDTMIKFQNQSHLDSLGMKISKPKSAGHEFKKASNEFIDLVDAVVCNTLNQPKKLKDRFWIYYKFLAPIFGFTFIIGYFLIQQLENCILLNSISVVIAVVVVLPFLRTIIQHSEIYKNASDVWQRQVKYKDFEKKN